MKRSDAEKQLFQAANKAFVKALRGLLSSDSERAELCVLCGTTWGYLKKTSFSGQKLEASVCINFEREIRNLGGEIRCEDLRPDVDWQYLRGTNKAAA